LKRDECGFEYIERLPPGMRVARLKDFITINLNKREGYDLNVGMMYFIKSSTGTYYLRAVSEVLQDTTILEHLERGMIYL
jgi:hypothetical protein